jgi:hypothetical protein
MDLGKCMVKKWCIKVVICLAVVLLTTSSMAKDHTIPKPVLKPAVLKHVQPPVEAPTSIKFPPLPILGGWPKAVVEIERRECALRLRGLDVTFQTMAPLGNDTGCGAPAPLLIDHIASVAIVPAAELTCDMAEALHGWLASSVLPAAQLHLKKRVIKINNASAYVCRRRNGLATGKLSEHAKANALDISTLAFDDGSSVNIKGDWSGLKQLVGGSAQGDFLRQIRRDACIRFTTVLGPGSDAYHGDHFHIDVARRKNGYRICN